MTGMSLGRVALTVAAAVAPALIAWWSDRRLLGKGDDPALPELLASRRRTNVRAIAVAAALMIVFAGGEAAWGIPLLLVLLIAVAYPLRTRLLGETWGFGSYLWRTSLSFVAGFGFWIALAYTPAVVQWVLRASGPERWMSTGVVVAALLTALLIDYFLAGGGSRSEAPPRDRLTDRQAGVTPPPAVEAQTEAGPDPMMTLSPDGPEAPPPEPEVEPGPVSQQPPVVRPAPPPLRTGQTRPSEQAEARQQAAARARAEARQLAEARAEALRQAQRRKAAAAKPPPRARPAPAPPRAAQARAPARTATARPIYNCRYARTRSEIAVCND